MCWKEHEVGPRVGNGLVGDLELLGEGGDLELLGFGDEVVFTDSPVALTEVDLDAGVV